MGKAKQHTPPTRRMPGASTWLLFGLGIVLAGILFPTDWPGRFFPLYSSVYSYIFSPLWVHLLMHTLLFAILALLLSWLTPRLLSWLTPARRWETEQRVLAVLAAILLVSVLQELIQAISRQNLGWAVLPESLFDVGIDLFGALLGLGVYHAWQARHASLPGQRKAHENNPGGG